MTKKTEEILDLRKKIPPKASVDALSGTMIAPFVGLRLGVAFGSVDGFYFADVYVV